MSGRSAEVERRDEMGISHADFLRIFPRLVTDAAHADIGPDSRVSWPDGRTLRVQVSPEQRRRIALLSIPYVDIRFEFQGFSATAREAFMGRFDRAFQKGGG